MNNTKPEKCIITIAVGMLIVCMLAAPAMGSCTFSPASPYMSLNVNEQQGIKMIGISKYVASPFVTFSADLELTDWIPGNKSICAACVDGNWEYSGDAALYLGDTYSVRGCIIEVIEFHRKCL